MGYAVKLQKGGICNAIPLYRITNYTYHGDGNTNWWYTFRIENLQTGESYTKDTHYYDSNVTVFETDYIIIKRTGAHSAVCRLLGDKNEYTCFFTPINGSHKSRIDPLDDNIISIISGINPNTTRTTPCVEIWQYKAINPDFNNYYNQ